MFDNRIWLTQVNDGNSYHMEFAQIVGDFSNTPVLAYFSPSGTTYSNKAVLRATRNGSYAVYESQTLILEKGDTFTANYDENGMPMGYTVPDGITATGSSTSYDNGNCNEVSTGAPCFYAVDEMQSPPVVVGAWQIVHGFFDSWWEGLTDRAEAVEILVTNEPDAHRIRIDLQVTGGQCCLFMSRNAYETRAEFMSGPGAWFTTNKDCHSSDDSRDFCYSQTFQNIRDLNCFYPISDIPIRLIAESGHGGNDALISYELGNLAIFESGTYYFYYDADETEFFNSGNKIYFSACLPYVARNGETIGGQPVTGSGNITLCFDVLASDDVVIGERLISWTDETELEAGDYWYRAVITDGNNEITSNADGVTVMANNTTNETPLTWTDETALEDGTYYYRALLTSLSTVITSNYDSVTIDNITDNTTSLTWTDETDLGTGTYWYRAVITNGDNEIASNADSIIIDETAPVVTLSGESSVSLANGASWIDPGATATDETDGTLTVTTSGTVDTQTAGTYTITYSATDAAGNTGTATRSVIVAAVIPPDTTAPVVTLTGDATINLANGASWIDPGATATDETDGSITPTITYSLGGESKQSFDSTQAGTWTITYSATDTAGNTGTATRSIVVAEAAAPDEPDDPDNPSDPDDPEDPGETIIDLTETTLTMEAHATSSKLILCTLSQSIAAADGITAEWQYTATDPAGDATPTWSSYGTSQTSSQTISGLTANQKYWFRAILTQGEETQTTGSDPAWLTQINRPARAIHETSVQDKNFGDSIIFLARLEDADGNCLTQDDISEIKYQIAILSTTLGSESFEAVDGHSNITVPKYPWLLEPFPVVDYGWTLDSTGYNFAFCPSNADDESFPSEGLYKITFSAILQNGEKLKFEYRIFLS